MSPARRGWYVAALVGPVAPHVTVDDERTARGASARSRRSTRSVQRCLISPSPSAEMASAAASHGPPSHVCVYAHADSVPAGPASGPCWICLADQQERVGRHHDRAPLVAVTVLVEVSATWTVPALGANRCGSSHGWSDSAQSSLNVAELRWNQPHPFHDRGEVVGSTAMHSTSSHRRRERARSARLAGRRGRRRSAAALERRSERTALPQRSSTPPRTGRRTSDCREATAPPTGPGSRTLPETEASSHPKRATQCGLRVRSACSADGEHHRRSRRGSSRRGMMMWCVVGCVGRCAGVRVPSYRSSGRDRASVEPAARGRRTPARTAEGRQQRIAQGPDTARQSSYRMRPVASVRVAG
jgi:hypothetical protein